MKGSLKKEIVKFLTSLPNIDNVDGRRAFIYSASLESQLQEQVYFGGPTVEFVQLLVSTLTNYGTLENGQNALEAILESAKDHVGQDKKDYCDTIILKLQADQKLPNDSCQQLESPVSLCKCLLAIGLALVIFFIFSKTYFQVFELKSRDLKFKVRQIWGGPGGKDNKELVIIGLGDSFLQNNNVSQEKLTFLLSFLLKKEPAVIGLDVLLDKGKDGYKDLVRTIKTADNIIIPVDFRNPENLKELQREFQQFPEKVGFANFSHEIDDDDLIRRIPLQETRDDFCYYDMCYPFTVQILGRFYADKVSKKLWKNQLEKKKNLTINFDRPAEQFVSLVEKIDEPEEVEHIEKEVIKGKMLLIGYLGEKQPNDTFSIPLSYGAQTIRGVLLHAYVINTLYFKQYIVSSLGLDLPIILCFTFIGEYLSLRAKKLIKFLILTIILIFYVIITFYLFISTYRIDIPLWSPMVTLMVTAFLTLRRARPAHEILDKNRG